MPLRPAIAALVLLLSLPFPLSARPTTVPSQPTDSHARHAPPSLPALRELQSRLLNRTLPATAADPIIDQLLDLQSDPAAKWNPAYGDFLESLRNASLLRDTPWETYLKQSVTLTGRIRPDVCGVDPIPFEYTTAFRLGSRTRLRFTTAGTIAFDAHPSSEIDMWTQSWSDLTSTAQYPILEAVVPWSYPYLTPGRHTAHLTVEFTFADPTDSGVRPATLRSPLTTRRTIDLPFTLHPHDHPTVRLIDNPALRDSLPRTLVITPKLSNGDRGELSYTIDNPNLPIPIAYDVEFRTPDGQSFGTTFFDFDAKGGWISCDVTPRPAAGLKLPPTLTLILRPSTFIAAHEIDITEILAGDITLPNLPTSPPAKTP